MFSIKISLNFLNYWQNRGIDEGSMQRLEHDILAHNRFFAGLMQEPCLILFYSEYRLPHLPFIINL